MCKRHVERCRGRGDGPQPISNDQQSETLRLDLGAGEETTSSINPPVTYEVVGSGLLNSWPQNEVQGASPTVEYGSLVSLENFCLCVFIDTRANR